MDNGISTKLKTSPGKRLSAIIAALFTLALFVFNSAALAQTQLPIPGGDFSNNPPGQSDVDLSQGAGRTQTTAERIYDAPGQTTLVREQAEQNTTQVAQSVEQKLWPAFGSYNDVYQGLSAFWGDDIISNFFANIGQLIGKWLSEFINGWIADAVQFLTGFLRIFVLNPNIATNGLAASGGPADDISPYIRQGADIMYGIAVDLLLLLFIMCIWKYWADAAWRGGSNMMGAVGRLIFTAGLMLAWPTIYAFEIQITNEMIKAVYFNSADQVAMLDAAMAAAVKAGLVAGAGLLANATAPIGGQVFGGLLAGGAGGIVLGTVGGFVAFVGLIIYLIVGGILVAELIYILVLKAIQTALLCAQYMFAPIFLVFFALPDTENVTSGFVRSFVEVSLWTFVWVGMLKILVVVVLSDFNPWGKIVMAVGVLQLMIQVPSFLARAQISPMSDFVSAGLVTGGILGAGKALSNVVSNRGMHLANAIGNFGFAGAKGAPKSQSVDLNSPNDVANPDLLKKQRQASATGTVDGQGQKLNPAEEAKKKADEAKKAEAARNGPEAKKDKNGNPMGTPPGQAAALNPDGTPKTPAEAEAAKQKQAEMAAMLGQKLADRNAAGTPGATPPKANDPASAANLASTTGVTPPVTGTGATAGNGTGTGNATGTVPGANTTGAKLDSATGAAAAAAALAAKNGTGVPKTGDPGALEGKTDATVKNKADAANAATTNANNGKPLTPEDAAKAAAANAALNTGLTPPGTKPKDGQVEVEGTNTPAGGVAGAQAGKLNTANGDPAKGNTPGQVGADGDKSTIKAPGVTPGGAALNTAGAAADTNLVQKPGITPPNAVPPGSSAQLAEAAKGINRGTADFTTKAGSTDVTVEGDAGAPLSQVSTKDAGKIVGNTAAPIVGGAIIGASAAVLGTKLAGQGQQPGANVNADTTTNINQVPGQNANVNPQLGPNGQPVNPVGLTGAGTNAGGQLKTQGGTTDINVEGDTNNPNNPGQVTTNATGRVVTPGSQGITPPGLTTAATTAAATLAATRLANAGAPGVNVDTTANVNQLPGQNTGLNATQQVGANGQPISPANLTGAGTPAANGQLRTAGATSDINVEGDSNNPNNPGQVTTSTTGRVVTPGSQGITPPGLVNTATTAAATVAANRLANAGAPGVNVDTTANVNQLPGQNTGLNANQQIGANGQPISPANLTGAGTPAAGGQVRTAGATSDINVEGDSNNPNNPGQVTTNATGRVVSQGGSSLIPPPGIVPSTSAAAMSAGRLNNPGAAGPGVNVDTTANVNQLPGQNTGFNANQQIGANGLPINPGSLNTAAGQVNQARTQTGTADINVEGETIGQNGQVVTNATGRVVSSNPVQNAANVGAAVVTGAAATIAANRMAGNNGQPQQQNIDIQAQGIGSQGAPTAPPTQFTTAHRVVGNPAGAGSPPPPPSSIDGSAGMDDGSGNGGSGGFTGGTLPPIGSGGKPAPPNPNDPRPDMFNNHHQAGYNKVPFRVAAANARLAQGATIGTSNTGSDYVVYDNQGHAMHYRFAEGATQERKAMGMIAGSLGELMSTDAEAYDSARQSAIDAGEHKPQGAMERIASGILAYNGSSWTQTAAAKQRFARSMAKHANLGSQAYVNGGQGNAYTQFLENRYGHMDDEKQAEAVHIMTTDDTPESGWSWRLQPSTEALIQNGIGISPVNRACAANMAVLKAQPWLRGAAIRGSAAYMESKANSSLPDDTHAMVKNSWYAHHAQAMSPETVNCVGALTLASGDANICRDSAMVDQVVSMVPSGGRPEDYVGAYNALQTGSRVVKSMMAPRSGAASVGSVRGGGGGYSVGGGGGTNHAEMDVIVESGSSSAGSFNPASVNLGGIGGNSGVSDTRVDVRTSSQSSAGANLGSQTVRVPGGTNNPGQVRMGSMTQSGGGPRNQDDQVQVDVEIGSSGAPGSSADDIQRAALNSALQYFGGNSTELVKTVTANLVASGMSYNDMNNPNLMKTAIQSYATNPTSMPQVALAANAVGPANVKPQHVEIVQNMQDNDPRWDSRSITPQAMYTASAIVEAHQANPQAYGPAYLTQEYVQKVASYPGFRPREMPMRGANGQVSYQERTPVPAEVILNHLADKMRRFGNVQ